MVYPAGSRSPVYIRYVPLVASCCYIYRFRLRLLVYRTLLVIFGADLFVDSFLRLFFTCVLVYAHCGCCLPTSLPCVPGLRLHFTHTLRIYLLIHLMDICPRLHWLPLLGFCPHFRSSDSRLPLFWFCSGFPDHVAVWDWTFIFFACLVRRHTRLLPHTFYVRTFLYTTLRFALRDLPPHTTVPRSVTYTATTLHTTVACSYTRVYSHAPSTHGCYVPRVPGYRCLVYGWFRHTHLPTAFTHIHCWFPYAGSSAHVPPHTTLVYHV